MRSGIGDQSRSELERILLEGPRIKDLSAVVRGRERCSVAITNILGALTVHAPTGQGVPDRVHGDLRAKPPLRVSPPAGAPA